QKIAYSSAYLDNGRLMVRFAAVPAQLEARDAVNQRFADRYVTALSFAPRTPEWVRKIGLRPMPLGLDLRGGLYLLYQVDVNGAVEQYLNTITQDFQRALKEESIAYTDINSIKVNADIADGVRVLLPAGADL